MADPVLLLSTLMGTAVLGPDRRRIGTVADLAAQVGPAHPEVRKIVLGGGRRRSPEAHIGWDRVTGFGDGYVEIGPPGPADTGDAVPAPNDLLLARDVLDTQVVDVVGKRIARVSDVLLGPSGGRLRVLGVDVGPAGVWRRLAPRRLSPPRSPREQVVDWADLHLTSERGHQLQIGQPASQIHRLTAIELAALLAQLPARTGGRLLTGVSPKAGADALSAGHPATSGRLLRAVPDEAAAALVEGMPFDDATAVLRTLPLDRIDALLAGLSSERAETLRRLLAHPAGTAAGLMNTDVRTAAVGEPPERLRARVASEPRELEGMATFFVVDEAGRPVGSYEPSDLLANRAEPKKVPTVPLSLPVERVIDLFALHDYLALPVVDDGGRLVGAVAVDDVLEELLAERLPGRGRFAGVRRWRGTSRSALQLPLPRSRSR